VCRADGWANVSDVWPLGRDPHSTKAEAKPLGVSGPSRRTPSSDRHSTLLGGTRLARGAERSGRRRGGAPVPGADEPQTGRFEQTVDATTGFGNDDSVLDVTRLVASILTSSSSGFADRAVPVSDCGPTYVTNSA